MRMKSIMTNHIDQNRRSMFCESTDAVKLALNNMVQAVKLGMLTRTKEIVSSLERDYRSALLAISDELSAEQLSIQSEIENIISNAEIDFKCLANLEAEPNDGKGKLTDDDPGTPTYHQPVAVAS